ncbi:MAG: RNA polymerase sigma factor [Deltaproteobacteria bacterium]|nr:RNA polymerase sigma factor [Deltaproteobacteria bacterium]
MALVREVQAPGNDDRASKEAADGAEVSAAGVRLETETGLPSTWTDEALLARVRTGSEEHFDVLYERYFQRIYSFVYVRVHNHADAEELTQETFTVVFRSADGWAGRSTPLAWIYGVAKNTVYNHLRRHRIHDERIEQAGPGLLVSDSATWACTPEDHLEMSRYARAMHMRLKGVASWQAEAFLMRHVHNLSIREISQRTDRSGDAIRSGLYRVKRLLLEAHGQEGARAT